MTTENDKKTDTNETLFKKLINRRIPQITGIYLGAGWGIVQFIDWISNRYMLSPHLVELAFVILISLLPSIIIIAYYHGMPGRNRWRKLEKIGVPLNIILTVMLIMFVFNGTDFGRISKEITIKDETGQSIQRVIPKAEYLKKIALFYIDNTSNDSSLDWLQYGFIHMLELDLSQDLFLDIITPSAKGMGDQVLYIIEKIKKAGFKKGVDLPLLLKREIANEYYKDYFLSGTLNKNKEDIIFNLTLFDSKNARQVANKSFRFKISALFTQIDQITVWIKKELDIPGSHIRTANDLPLAEMFTASIDAARSYSKGVTTELFQNDWAAAQKYLNRSLTEDPAFTLARLRLIESYAMSNQADKVPGIYQEVMRGLFKLPERQQLYVKFGYYSMKGDMEKQIAVVRMIIKLYPRDINAYALLAMFLEIGNQHDEAITQYKKILEIDPGRGKALRAIGKIYEDKGDLEHALSYYKTYSQRFPDDPGAFTAIGQLYEKTRDNENAKKFYEKSLLLKPDDIDVLVKLAGIDARIGHFDEANRQYLDALELSSAPKDKATVYEDLADLCETRGQIQKALEYTKLRLNNIKKYMSPFFVSIHTTFSMSAYIHAGQEKEAFEILDALKQELKPPQDSFVPFGYLIANLELENAAGAEKYLPAVEDMIKKFGMKKIEFMIHRARGKIFQLKGEYESAIESFRKGLELQPLDDKFKLRIGSCYRKLKQYGEAEEILLTSLKREPFSPKLNVELALLYQDMNEKENALKHIKIAIDIWKDADQNYKQAIEAKKLLEQLQ